MALKKIDFEGALRSSELFDRIVILAAPYFAGGWEEARVVFVRLCIYYVPVLPSDLEERHLQKLAAVVDTAAPAYKAIPDREKRLELAAQILSLAP